MRYRVIYDETLNTTDYENASLLKQRRFDIYGPEANLQFLSAKVSNELNNAGTFDFTIPPNHLFYHRIENFISTIEVYEIVNNVEYLIFIGRPIQMSTDYYNNKKITCEGALAYLNDIIQPARLIDPKDEMNVITFYEEIIDYYNRRLGMSGRGSYRKMFYKHNNQEISNDYEVNYTDPNYDDGTDIKPSDDAETRQKKQDKKKRDNKNYIYRNTNYETTLNTLTSYILDTDGGYLYVKKSDQSSPLEEDIGKLQLWWYQDPSYIWGDVTQNQLIEYYTNVKDFTQNIDATQIYTRLIPLGGSKNNGKAVTIEKVNNDLNYIDNIFIASFGVIETVKQFNDCQTPKKLYKKAEEWLSKEVTNQLSIEVSATDLSYIEGSNYDIPFLIGQYVAVILIQQDGNTSSSIGRLPITKIEYDLLTGEKNLTLGKIPRKRLTEIKKENSGVSDDKKKSDNIDDGYKLQDDGDGLGILHVEENDIYYADDGYAWNEVEVAVTSTGSGGVADLIPLNVTENGVYPRPSNKGYSTVTVSVQVDSQLVSYDVKYGTAVICDFLEVPDALDQNVASAFDFGPF